MRWVWVRCGGERCEQWVTRVGVRGVCVKGVGVHVCDDRKGRQPKGRDYIR